MNNKNKLVSIGYQLSAITIKINVVIIVRYLYIDLILPI
jgi:hypothetical protein